DGGTISLTTFVSLAGDAGGGGGPGPSALLITHSDTLVIDALTGLTKGITIARDSSAANFRLFDVQPTANLTLQGLTLSGGLAQGFNGGSTGGAAGGGGGSAGLGGAIFNEGTLTILDSTLTGNTAQGGKGGNALAHGAAGAAGGGGAGLAGPGGYGYPG